MADITMGNPAIESSGLGLGAYTMVDKKTPADGTGTIATVEVWSTWASTGGIVATFSANGNNLTTHDYEAVGNVAEGYNSFEVTLAVTEGDYIGIYFTPGETESTFTGAGPGEWYKSGDQTNVSDVAFTYNNNYYISLRGTGTTEEAAENNAIMMGTNF